jgi:hypothetical protein
MRAAPSASGSAAASWRRDATCSSVSRSSLRGLASTMAKVSGVSCATRSALRTEETSRGPSWADNRPEARRPQTILDLARVVEPDRKDREGGALSPAASRPSARATAEVRPAAHRHASPILRGRAEREVEDAARREERGHDHRRQEQIGLPPEPVGGERHGRQEGEDLRAARDRREEPPRQGRRRAVRSG